MVASHGVDKTPHAVCLVFENLKVARGRKRVKLWVEIKHLRFIFVCLVNPHPPAEEVATHSTEKLV